MPRAAVVEELARPRRRPRRGRRPPAGAARPSPAGPRRRRPGRQRREHRGANAAPSERHVHRAARTRLARPRARAGRRAAPRAAPARGGRPRPRPRRPGSGGRSWPGARTTTTRPTAGASARDRPGQQGAVAPGDRRLRRRPCGRTRRPRARRPRRPASSADEAHGPARCTSTSGRPCRGRPPCARPRPRRSGELLVARPGAHRPAQVGLPLGEQAGAQLAVGGEAQPVAARAERLGDRRDELEHPGAVGEAPARAGGRGALGRHAAAAASGAPIMSRSSSPESTASRVHSRGASSGMTSMKRTTYGRRRASSASGSTSGSLTPRSATALTLIGRSDSWRSHAARPASTRSRSRRRVIIAKRSGSSESMSTFRRLEAVRDQVVDRVRQQDAVGGHRHLADAGRRDDAPDQRRQAGPHQRLAARDADLADPEAGEQVHQPHQLVVGEELLAGQPLHPLRRHAVAAAEVAAVGDRESQRAVGPPEAVGEPVHRPESGPAGARPRRGHDAAGAGSRPPSRGTSTRERFLHRPARQDPDQVAPEVRRRPGVARAGRSPRRPSRPPGAPPSRGAPAIAASAADARSGVWPMLVRPILAPSMVPLASRRAPPRPRSPSRARAGGT